MSEGREGKEREFKVERGQGRKGGSGKTIMILLTREAGGVLLSLRSVRLAVVGIEH